MSVMSDTTVNSDRWYSTREVARLLGVTQRTVGTMITDGRLVASRPGKRHYKVWGADLVAFRKAIQTTKD